MYMCLCKGLTERDVLQIVGGERPQPELLISALGLEDDACCGRCVIEIDDFVALLTQHAPNLQPSLAT